MKEVLTKIGSKKILLQIYFILFIILNLLDFFNIIPNDLDFFKKLLSWSIIAYIFYKVSPTKIFTGNKIKKYDIMYIIGFSFIAIAKDLKFYVQNLANGTNNIPADSFNFIFEKILQIILNIDAHIFVNYSMIFGIFICSIISIKLLKNYNIEENSLLGSIKLNDYLRFMKFQYIILIIISLFFAIIIVNLFMEWFALAVDSVILVLGLFYYLFKYIHDHQYNQTSLYLQKITNSGNNFFQSLITTFSNKKTFFIGISFLLTLHLLVDAGVYLIPYTIGTENALYFENLNSESREHKPLLNFINFENSQINVDSENLKNLDSITSSIIMLIGVILLYFTNLFLIFALLTLPFYIYYMNIQNKEIQFTKNLTAILLSSIILYLTIFIGNNFSQNYGNLENPINIDNSQDKLVLGIDIYTKPVTLKLIENKNIIQTSIEIILSIFIFIISLYFFRKEFEKHKTIFKKIIYIIVLIFFLGYISSYYISSTKIQIENFKTNLNINYEKPSKIENQNETYNKINKIYLDKNNFKDSREYTINNLLENLTISIEPFSNISKENILSNQNHEDYIKMNFHFKSNTEKLVFEMQNNSDSIIFNENELNNYNFNYKLINKTISGKVFENNSFSIFIMLNKNFFTKDNNKIISNIDKLSLFNI
ncbi:MAG: hypothetical protein KC589_03280 [Nanoarchaeota archaeon]|nr:hypothetical protein [Nanoarchaeota archaeon]